MSQTKSTKLSLEKVLHLLRKPDARLVRLHSNNGGAGFYVWPRGGRVSDEVAQLLLKRDDIRKTMIGTSYDPEGVRDGLAPL